MLRYRVSTPEEALAYITDCTLATVAQMASLKSRKVGEYARQKSIAQCAINWMAEMKCSSTNDTRIEDVIEHFASDVNEWAKQYENTP